jgi:hypothetical protein
MPHARKSFAIPASRCFELEHRDISRNLLLRNETLIFSPWLQLSAKAKHLYGQTIKRNCGKLPSCLRHTAKVAATPDPAGLREN